LGVAQTYPELGDAGQSMRADTSGARGAWLRQRVTVRPPAGTNTVIITHAPNISEAFQKDGKGLEDGEALIFRPDGHGTAALIASVKIDEWPRWAASP
jgi:hypothetical protein